MSCPKFYRYAKVSGLVNKDILDKLLRESYHEIVKQKKNPNDSSVQNSDNPPLQFIQYRNKNQPIEFKRNNIMLRYGNLSSIRSMKKNTENDSAVSNDSTKTIDTLAALDGEITTENKSRMTELDRLLATKLLNCGILNRWQTDQLLAGRTKFTLGNYKILNAIGKGGYGHVFLGRECDDNMKTDNLLSSDLLTETNEGYKPLVALKVLPLSKTTAELSERFRHEITLQKRLRHPNLVRFIDSGHDGNVDFMVHEFIDGGDVKMLLQREGVIPYDIAAAIIVELSKCVQYLHDQHIIHRDIKPANILISSKGEAKLIDLGLSIGYDLKNVMYETSMNNKNNYFEKELTKMNPGMSVGKIAGTIDYVAPDQIRNPEEPVPAWDIYSIGCSFYQLLTGRVPFPKGDLNQKLSAHVNAEPIDPRVFNQSIPFHIAEITLSLLAKDPLNRIKSAQEIVKKLSAWIHPDGLSEQLICMPEDINDTNL
ncbi:MAG: serine/threonine protein kinase [Planctomycetaceae bacterium]|nr:serine/threonine protein kinase [Planctomycetaceae bacterium]